MLPPCFTLALLIGALGVGAGVVGGGAVGRTGAGIAPGRTPPPTGRFTPGTAAVRGLVVGASGTSVDAAGRMRCESESDDVSKLRRAGACLGASGGAAGGSSAATLV